MIRSAAAALIALALAAPIAAAQDTVASYRHLLSLDLSRVKPFQRSYDMIVKTGDSSHVIGQRDVSLAPATYAGRAAWLLVETRTGMVPVAESLYLAPDMRPIHWASSLGRARLGIEFVGDSIFGATTTPGGKHSILMPGRPDLLVSLAMVEALLPLLPLDSTWSDSAGVLAVDARSATVLPAELVVVAQQYVGDPPAPLWAVSVRSESASLSVWVRADSGDVTEMQQTLPAHVGTVMQFQRKATPPPATPVPPPPSPSPSRE